MPVIVLTRHLLQFLGSLTQFFANSGEGRVVFDSLDTLDPTYIRRVCDGSKVDHRRTIQL